MRATAGVLILGVLSMVFAVAAHPQDQSTPSDAKPAASDAKTPASGPAPLKVGANVMSAKLTHQVSPVYPPIAKTAHIEGTVVLKVVVAKDGKVQDVQFVSGPPLLQRAAMDAVKQWTYQPTLLNGEAVAVETTVEVIFKLSEAAPGGAPVHTEEGAGGVPPSLPKESPAIDPQYKTDVLHLLDVMHYREMAAKGAKESFQSSRSRLNGSFPDTPNRDKIVDAFASKMVDLIQSQDFSDKIVAVYHQYLSDDEVNSLTQFYTTPAGQRFSAIEVEMFSSLAQAGNQVARDGLPGIFKGLCNDYPELQGKAKFCPAAPAPSGEAPETQPTLKPPAPPTPPAPSTPPTPPTPPTNPQ
ncbi:MAG: TonB family protein [Candidatus Acidiferrales bacterium]